MLIQTISIDREVGGRYDQLLADGWFRSKGIVYRSDLICMEESVFSVRHIRYSLKDFIVKQRHRKLMRRNDERFSTRVTPVNITEDMERLYGMQTKRFRGFIHSNLADVVFPFNNDSGFKTYELSIYDGERLIAVSFFDSGLNAAASLLCVYDSEYAKHSLGIYTMLKEIEYLKSVGAKYYYPGYVLDRPSCFDYKLSLGKPQWMGEDKKWHKEDPEIGRASKAAFLEQKMAELRVRLSLEGYVARMVYYPYFTAAYITEADGTLVKYPCYFMIDVGAYEYGATYDLETNDFVLFNPTPSAEYTAHSMVFSEDYMSSDRYEMRIMQSTFCFPLSELKSLAELHETETL